MMFGPQASRRGRVALTAAVLCLVVVVAGCTKDERDRDRTPDAVVGTVDWEDCFDDARDTNPDLERSLSVECGTVEVPKDWAEPDGATFDIAVMRIYSGDAEDKMGSVLTNPGGPGGSGLGFLPFLVPDLTSLMDEFIMVTFDPRGVGESEPVDCISDDDLDESFAYDPDPASQTLFDGNVELAERIGEGCADEYGDDLKLFSTVQTAKDMDAIRAAVGDEKLTYIGFSYGTLLGAVYAQLFPEKVRALVLDGAVDPQQGPVESSEGQAIGFERALDNFSAWCKDNASRCPIARDPRGAIEEVLDKARVDPVEGPDGREATAGWILWGVIVTMYSQDYWQYLGVAIDDLADGDAGLIFALADAYAEREPDGSYSNMFDANNAINCTDSEYPSVDEIRDLQSQWRDEYPMFGTALAVGLLNCSVWPGGKDIYPTGPAQGAPPILVVGTTGDPATPYESTQKLADMLGVGQVLTWEGEGHTAYPETRCINNAVDSYLINLTVPRAGTDCPAS